MSQSNHRRMVRHLLRLITVSEQLWQGWQSSSEARFEP